MRLRGIIYRAARRSARQRRYKATPQGRSADFVYAILGSHGLVKIGFSNDPRSRVRELQTGSPFELSLAYTHPTYGHGADVERASHEILDRHRQSGEWFSVPINVAVAAISGAAYEIVEAAEQEASRPNWLLRYGAITCALAPTWVSSNPLMFVAVVLVMTTWACLKVSRGGAVPTADQAARWAGTVIAAVVTSLALAMPFVAARG